MIKLSAALVATKASLQPSDAQTPPGPAPARPPQSTRFLLMTEGRT